MQDGLNDASKTEPLDPSTRAQHVVTLLLDCGTSARRWMEFYVAIQSGLAVGAGAAIGFWSTQPGEHAVVFGITLLALCFFAIAVCATITQIVLREHQWQTWFVGRFEAINRGDRAQHIYPRPEDGPVISSNSVGHIGATVRRLNRIVVCGWLCLTFVAAMLALSGISGSPAVPSSSP